MSSYIILGALTGFPLLLGILFRVNPSHLFFSVMAGELLGRYFGDDAELVIKSLTNSETFAHYAELVIIVLPILFTALFLKGSIEKTKLFYAWIPLLIAGVVLAAFALPTLPTEMLARATSTEIGAQAYESIELVIGVVVGFQLATLWLLNKNKGHSKNKH